MSVVGASIASSVAQTPVQTQQTAGQRDRADNETAREARDVRDLFQAHILAVDEDETDPDAASNPRVAEQLPEGQGSTQSRQDRPKRRPAPAGVPDGEVGHSDPAVTSSASANEQPELPLYRHLDVQG